MGASIDVKLPSIWKASCKCWRSIVAAVDGRKSSLSIWPPPILSATSSPSYRTHYPVIRRPGWGSVPAFLCSSGEVLCPRLVCILSLSPHPLLSTAHFNRQTHIGESNVTFSMLSAAGHKGRQQCNKEHKDWQTESVRTGTFRMPGWSPKNCRIK